jgi:metal transporter CNNM
MLPPGKPLSPLMSPHRLSQGLRKSPMASPLSPYHNGGSILRSPVSYRAQSPRTLPTTMSPGRSPLSQTPVRGSPTSSWVSSCFIYQVTAIHIFFLNVSFS